MSEEKLQYGALPYRIRKRQLQCLLITTRKKGRWSLPKGWPIGHSTPSETAAIEAFEEAGVHGVVDPVRLGSLTRRRAKREKVIRIFPMRVTRQKKSWPEKQDRRRIWVGIAEAAALVRKDDLRFMLQQLAHYCIQKPSSGDGA
jgi:ADP-ribose pyrophosphatase YjhB (NUDIX family)